MRKTNILLFLLIVNTVLFAQSNMKYHDNVLTKKEQWQLEQAINFQLDFYRKVFPDQNLNLASAKVSIHEGEETYRAKQKEVFGYEIKDSPGFYSGKEKEAVVLKKKGSDYMRTCYHEISHYFINAYSKNVPNWLNEGLATYFEYIKIGKKEVKAEKNRWYVVRVRTMIDTRDLDIADFLTWNNKKFRDMSFSHQSYGYALSHMLVWFMMEKDPDLAVKCIQTLEGGKKGQEALEELYEGGFKKFESDFIEYAQK